MRPSAFMYPSADTYTSGYKVADGESDGVRNAANSTIFLTLSESLGIKATNKWVALNIVPRSHIV